MKIIVSLLLKYRPLAALSRARAFAVATALAALMSAAATPWPTAQAQTKPQVARQITPPKSLLGNALAGGVASTQVVIVGDTLVVEGLLRTTAS